MTTCVVGGRRCRAAREGQAPDGDHTTASTPIRPSSSPRRPTAWIVGTIDRVVEQLQALEEAGVERVMLQHLDHEDLDGVELIGAAVVPHVA